MTTTNKILLGSAAALGVGAFFYRSGINHLQFGIDGYVPGPDGSIQMRIKVTNPSALFGYPVPEMFVVVYDSNDNIVGTILNKQLQWISSNGTSYIYGTVQPNYQNLVSIITSLIQNGGALPTGLTFDGQIRVGRILIPFTTQAGMAGRKKKTVREKLTLNSFENGFSLVPLPAIDRIAAKFKFVRQGLGFRSYTDIVAKMVWQDISVLKQVLKDYNHIFEDLDLSEYDM